MFTKPCRLFLLVSLVLALLLAACSVLKPEESRKRPAQMATPFLSVEEPPNIAPPAKQVVITFACPDRLRSAYEDLARAFSREHPNVRIIIQSLDQLKGGPGLPFTERVKRVAQGADTFVWGELGPGEGILQGYLLDLQPFIEADSAFPANDFFPGLLQRSQWQGGQWSFPAEVAPYVILYQKDVFDAAGVAYPEPGWTWDDLLDKALALTRHQGDEVVLFGFGDPFDYAIKPYVVAHAGALVDEGATPPRPRLDDPPVVQALQGYADLALRHHVMPNHAQLSDDQSLRLVESGELAMWADRSSRFTYFAALPNLGLAPLPRGVAKANPVVMHAFYISAGTVYPRESWQWITYLSQRFTGAQGLLPARRSTLEGTGFRDQMGEETAALLVTALESGIPLEDNFATYWPLYDAAQAVLKGEQTAKQALAAAQARVLEQAAQLASIQPETIIVATPEPGEPVVAAMPRPEQPAGSAGQKMVFISGLLDERRMNDAYEALAAEFHRTHPNLIVETRPFSSIIGGGVSEETLPRLAASADCFVLPWQSWLNEQLANFLPLDPLLEADATFPDDFYPSTIDALRVAGQLWGLPKEVYPWMMFYNKTAFDAVGLAYPSPGWNLDDFQTLAVALTGGEGPDKRYGYLPYPSLLTDAAFFIEQYGARLMDDSTGSVTYRFDTPATVKAVQWYTNLRSALGVMPERRSGQREQDPMQAVGEWQVMIRGGQAAMWSSYPVLMAPGRPFEKTIEVGVAPMPRGPGRVASFALMAYYISAQTEHPQACWEWLKFLTEQPTLFSLYSATQTGLPPRRSVAESSSYEEQVGQAAAAAYRTAIEQGDHLAALAPVMSRLEITYPLEWFGGAVQAVTEGEDAASVLSEAQHRAEAYVGCLATRQNLEGEEPAKACLREVDPDFPFHEP